MELIKYTGSSFDRDVDNSPAEEGLHLPGLSEHDSETLCGYCLTGAPYDLIEGNAPTCSACIAIMKELFFNRKYTKKQIKGWQRRDEPPRQ